MILIKLKQNMKTIEIGKKNVGFMILKTIKGICCSISVCLSLFFFITIGVVGGSIIIIFFFYSDSSLDKLSNEKEKLILLSVVSNSKKWLNQGQNYNNDVSHILDVQEYQSGINFFTNNTTGKKNVELLCTTLAKLAFNAQNLNLIGFVRNDGFGLVAKPLNSKSTLCIYRNLTNSAYDSLNIPEIQQGTLYKSIYKMQGLKIGPFSKSMVGRDLRYRPWYITSINSPIKTSVEWCHNVANNVMVSEASKKRYNVYGEFVGVTVVSFTMENMYDFLSEFDEFDGIIYLWDITLNLLIGSNINSKLVQNGTSLRISPLDSYDPVIRKSAETLIQRHNSPENIPDITRPISCKVKNTKWLVTTKMVNLTEGTFIFRVVYLQKYSLIYGKIDQATDISITLSILSIFLCLVILAIGSIILITLPLSKLVFELRKVETMDLDKINLGGGLIPALFLTEVALVRTRFKEMISKLKEYATFLPYSLLNPNPKDGSDGSDFSSVNGSSPHPSSSSIGEDKNSGSKNNGSTNNGSTNSESSVTSDTSRQSSKKSIIDQFNVGLFKQSGLVMEIRIFGLLKTLDLGIHDQLMQDYNNILTIIQDIINRGKIMVLTFDRLCVTYNSTISCLLEALLLKEKLLQFVSNEIYKNNIHFKIIICKGIYYRGVVGNAQTKLQVFKEDYKKERLLYSIFNVATNNEITLSRDMQLDEIDKSFLVELEDVLNINNLLYPLFLLKNSKQKHKSQDEWLYVVANDDETVARLSFRKGFVYLNDNNIDEAKKCFEVVNDGGKLGETTTQKLAVRMIEFCKTMKRDSLSLEKMLIGVKENKSIFLSLGKK